MNALIILGLITGLTTMFLIVIRTSASVVFLVLCAGIVLRMFVIGDLTLVMKSTVPNQGMLAEEALNISLVVLPAFIAAILLRKSSKGSKAMLNVLPAIAVGLLTALSVVPLFAGSTKSNITSTQMWATLENMQGFIVAFGLFVSMLFLKSTHKQPHPTHKKKHK